VLVKLVIQAAAVDQLVVGALLYYTAFSNTRMRSACFTADRRWAMMSVVRPARNAPNAWCRCRSYRCRAPKWPRRERRSWVGDDHARNRQPLALATRHAYALAPHHCIQPCGSSAMKSFSWAISSAATVCVVGFAPQGQVGAHAVVEQHRMLQHHTDVLAHGFQPISVTGTSP